MPLGRRRVAEWGWYGTHTRLPSSMIDFRVSGGVDHWNAKEFMIDPRQLVI
jgi:hypothetical protein